MKIYCLVSVTSKFIVSLYYFDFEMTNYNSVVLLVGFEMKLSAFLEYY